LLKQGETGLSSINRTARIAGVLYLLLMPLGVLGILIVPSMLYVPGDAAATATNIMASESLFRLSILSALLVQIINIGVVVALYKLLKPVNSTMAALMAIFILLGGAIAMLNEVHKFAVLILLGGADYLTAFSAEQLQGLASFFLDVHEYGVAIASIFWGLWLFPMGWLVFKSGFLPRFIGILLMIGCVGYVVDFLIKLLLPDLDLSIAQFTFIGEIMLPLWLLIKGVNVEKWEARAAEAANS
jgi:hypothetical protein